MQTDIIIIGTGISAKLSALYLNLHGFNVIVFHNQEVNQDKSKKIILNVKSTKSGTDELIRSIKNTFSNSEKSNCNIGIKFTKDIDGQKYEQIFEFPDNYKIEPNNDTIRFIEKMDHVVGLEFIYKV